MLDPAFEDDPPSPSNNELTKTWKLQQGEHTQNKQMSKNRMQLVKLTDGGAVALNKGRMPVSDYNCSSTWVRQGSLLDKIGTRSKAEGIKEHAWQGIASEVDEKRLTHHKDRHFIDQDRKR